MRSRSLLQKRTYFLPLGKVRKPKLTSAHLSESTLSLRTALKAFLDVDRVLTAVSEYHSSSERQLIGLDYSHPYEAINTILGTVDK